MKVVINKCYGGFGLSHEAILEYAKRAGFELFSKKEFSNFYSYYKCPPEEYDRLAEESLANTGNYSEINSKDLYFSTSSIERNDPILVSIVEEMGESANGKCSDLFVVEIPDDVDWDISEYDGYEHIAEVHHTWG